VNTAHTSNPVTGQKLNPTWIIVFYSIILMIANSVVFWPGIMNWDSESQYNQALTGNYGDWHPPIMAKLWSFYIPLLKGGGLLLLTHLAVFWTAICLVSISFSRRGNRLGALAILVISVLPPFLAFNAYLIKDVGMAVSLLGAFAITFYFRAAERPLPLPALFAVLVLLIYAALVRANGIFAAAPLAIYALAPSLKKRLLLLAIISVCMVGLWIPLSGVINHRVLNAASEYPIRSLKEFDLVGIARYSGDLSVFIPDSKITPDVVRRCYSPGKWDSLGSSPCDILGQVPNYKSWALLIAAHPFAYATHRLMHMNEELHALTPPDVGPKPLKWNFPHFHREAFDARVESILTFSPNVPLFAPLVTFVLALFITGLSFRSRKQNESTFADAAFFLAGSSAMYTGAFAVVGVADDYRYEYYPMIAAMIALVSYVCSRESDRSSFSTPERLGIAAVGFAATVVLIARLTLQANNS
jgi:hypothetical protein